MTKEEALKKISSLLETLAKLKETIEDEVSDDSVPERPGGVRCWACGGGTNPSTIYNRFYCRQERGPCGVIRIYQAKGSRYDCDVSFQRTDTFSSGEAGTRLDVPSLHQKDMYLVTKGAAYNAKLIRQAMKGDLK